MCGIAGAVDLESQRRFSPTRLTKMALALAHRGPDDHRAVVGPGIALASRRLAIVDPAGGLQPVADPSGRVWAAVNGELFDHRDLRAALRAKGHRFASRSDSAVWPALYLEHGRDLFAHAKGQFAVAIWDQRDRRLILARDRVGICPLFVTKADGWLLFASEIKSLLASGLVDTKPDVRGLDHMFALFSAGTRQTCFANIESLAPGHLLDVADGQVRERRYWDLSFPKAGEERPWSARAADELETTLQAAVDRRLAADVPVATYLSGGLDSSLVLTLASRGARPAPVAFTVGFAGDEGHDEQTPARRHAARSGSRHHVEVLDGSQILDAIPEAVLGAEGPIMDTANACLVHLAQAVRAAGFKTVLTGEGADEAFAGYDWHRIAALLGPGSAALGALTSLLFRRSAQRSLTWPRSPTTPLFVHMAQPLARARDLFYSDSLWARLDGYQPLEELDLIHPEMATWAPLNQAIYLDYKNMLPGHLLLGKGDRVAMHAGVECRYPFLDERVVELAASLAPMAKARLGRGKRALRAVASRLGLRPPPKTMFKARSLCQLAPSLPPWIGELLTERSLRATGYFDPARIRREEALQARLPPWAPHRFVADASYTAAVTTQLWHHLFVSGGLCSLPRWTPPSDDEVERAPAVLEMSESPRR